MKTKKLGISLLLFCIHVQPLTNPSGFKLWTQERPPTTTTFSKTSLSSCWASSLKTDLLLHLLLRWYSQPEVGVILVRNKSDHDTFLPRVLEGSRSVKVKIKVITVSFVTPHNLASCDSLISSTVFPPGFALPCASWPPFSCWNWQPCSKLKALEPSMSTTST